MDAYYKEDKDCYFGRSQETEELYQLLGMSDLVLLIGKSGTGKTSLIRCGLGNRVKENSWYPLFIRRKHLSSENFVNSLNLVIHTEFEKTKTPKEWKVESIQEKSWRIYSKHLKQIYFILDQFEELFIDNPNEAEEAKALFQLLDELLNSDTPCKIIISMREEYVARLFPYEEFLPMLFDNRMRLEEMDIENAEEVVVRSFEYYNSEKYFKRLDAVKNYQSLELINPEKTAKAIVHNVINPKKSTREVVEDVANNKNVTIELPYLQIYLNALFNKEFNSYLHRFTSATGIRKPVIKIKANNSKSGIPRVNEVGRFSEVLPEFIDSIVDELTNDFKSDDQNLEKEFKEIPLLVLFALVSSNSTKLSLTKEQILNKLQYRHITDEVVTYCLERFEKMKIISPI